MLKYLVVGLFCGAAFAKGPVYDGVYRGVSPVDSERKFEMTFSHGTVTACNFNFICQNSAIKELLFDSSVDFYSPNGDHFWRFEFKYKDRSMFQVVSHDPDAKKILVLLPGAGVQVSLTKVE